MVLWLYAYCQLMNCILYTLTKFVNGDSPLIIIGNLGTFKIGLSLKF